MNSVTVNISLPKSLYEDAKRLATNRRYASISELVRDAVRRVLYPALTENGFTPEFEDEILRRAKESMENDVIWEGKEADLARYAKDSKKSRVR